MFIEALFLIVSNWKKPKLSVNWPIVKKKKKSWYSHIIRYNNIILSSGKDQITTFQNE